ncbi:MAG TPA: Hsp20/alpha crystallin family protein [Tenuifilaceae bacterium]|nr:Hsp20/alpha crystallin family protein [Tenuifilaceae bacterium]HNY08805.1 Hsp20/alpha crystallin family protein [Tenuifilaceae bacterium]HOA09428.1 Hsp20/alpha crystallin family protein [Tenuifilaceae bacterium]HOC36318.1 Hsp20/alpha crystallin family protein [Tenuifilaceae bacterium]HOG72051.1 Hsp20/alpha crystallin family protein [Tenuifilaceae bacterium]
MMRRRSTLPSIVDEFFGDDLWNRFFDDTESVTVPSVNIKEGKDEYAIEVAAPGFDKKDFRIDLNNNVLEISSEKEVKEENKDEKVMRREFRYSSFKRTFTLPDTVDTEKIKASYKDGILSISVPKKDEAKVKPTKQIAIS